MLSQLVSFWIQWCSCTLPQELGYQFHRITKMSSLQNSQPLVLCLIFAFFIIFLSIYWWLIRKPFEIIKDLSEVGFEHLFFGRKNRAAIVNEEIRNRSICAEDLPPVYPNGWIPVLQSHTLASGTVSPLRVWGQELAAFRSDSGTVFVVDAFCPHLGANLGVGGRIKGDCIECPFHGWSFRGTDGACVNIPYSDKVPGFSKLSTRVSCEANSLIFVWFHAEGEPPLWEVPHIEEIQNGSWTYRGSTQHTINCHIREIPENGADVAHLNELHSTSVLKGNRPWEMSHSLYHWWSSLLILKHTWTPTWSIGDKAHLVQMTLRHELALWGINIPFLGFTLDITQVGPALVFLRASTFFGRGAFVQSVTPEGPFRQKLVHSFYAESRFPKILNCLLLLGEAAMLERDIVVWNNKRLLHHPMLVAEDKFIAKFRRWYSQFYSEHSPTLQSIRKQSLDW